MAVMTWDSQLQAFVDSETPLTYNPQLEAWEDTDGLEYNHELEAWEKVWPKELVIYDHGDECIDVTGGWVDKTLPNRPAIPSIRNADNMQVKMTMTSLGNADCIVITAQKIDVSRWRYAYFEVDVLTPPSRAYDTYLEIHVRLDADNFDYKHMAQLGDAGRQVARIDLSGIEGGMFVTANASKGGMGTITSANPDMKIYKVWLE